MSCYQCGSEIETVNEEKYEASGEQHCSYGCACETAELERGYS